METIQLDIKSRDRRGSSASRQYRRQGMLPGVIYSGGKAAKSILVPYKEFYQAAKKSKTSQVFSFKSDDKELDGVSAVVRDLQKEFTREAVLHVDFQLLEEGSAVRVKVPLEIVGVAFGVKNEGGILQVSARDVTINSLPKNIPSVLKVDVTDLKLGYRIKTGDINLPEGVTLAGNSAETVVSVVSTRASSTMDEAPTITADAAAEAGAAEATAGADDKKADAAKKEGSK
ncbi:MAG: 50S ribosomal protein L25 [Bdellovibrionales bacterium]|nr:50S ribosomal protein L25 [Bdellovibrionales bacterium]